MMRRTIAMGAGLLILVALALLPATASAQYVPPPTIETTTTSVLPDEETTTTTTTEPEETTTTEPEETTTTAVESDEVTPPTTAPEVAGDVVRRPLPRTGSDLNGTALFGGAMTVLGIVLALGARRRRNTYENV